MKTVRCLTNSNSTSSFIVLEYKMKSEIHPNYNNLKAKCGCGNEINVGSTRSQDMYLDVCSACHPFYTGKQKIVDSGGRIDRFNKRFGTKKA